MRRGEVPGPDEGGDPACWLHLFEDDDGDGDGESGGVGVAPDAVTQAALRLPEVEERPHFGMPSVYVRGKGFASVSRDGEWLLLQLPPDEVDAQGAKLPGSRPLTRSGTTIGIEVPLAALDTRALDDLLRRAWAHRAPERLLAAHEELRPR